MNKKVFVAMSGGVDSSVCAAVLKEQGYDISGITLRLFDCEKNCGSLSDVDDARRVAEKMGIEHFVYDFKENFKENVIEKFVCDYEDGLTPNPCINCNRYIKFKALLSNLEGTLATGHYAKVLFDEKSGRSTICRFLCCTYCAFFDAFDLVRIILK